MHQDNPHLSKEINDNLRDMELNGGIWYSKLPIGSRVEVVTKNTRYQIEKRSEDESFIQGHSQYCPIPTLARIHGSTFGGSMIRVGWLGVGMHLEFSLGKAPVPTSEIQSVQLLA
jgi:hypothetical protein